MSLKLKLALIAFFVSTNVQADNLCGIDHVEKSKGGIRVVFTNNYPPNILGIKHPGSEKTEPFKAGSALILKEGDQAAISEGPHDFCTLTAEKRENKLGILINANNHIPGVPQTNRSEFISP